MSVQMIACSNIKSQNYQPLNKRSKANAKWENIVSLQLQQGDMINVESATLNLRGISSDQTIEIDGENNTQGLSDAKVGMRFSPYVNDNGVNTVALPFASANREVIFPLSMQGDDKFPEMTGLSTLKKEGDVTDPDNYIPFDYLPMRAFVDNGDDNNMPTNALEPIYNDFFQFDYNPPSSDITQIPCTPFGKNLKTIYTEKPVHGSWNSVSGHKYTILHPNYLGPFRTDEDTWASGENDCKAMQMDVKVELQAPLYESPSTIASQINHQLNTSDVFGDSNINPTVKDKYLQDQKLPTLSGNLLQVKEANGVGLVDRHKLWGNMAVRDLRKWQGIHALMRCDLAFYNAVNYKDDATAYKMYLPCLYMPNANYAGQTYYPRISKEFKWKYKNFEGGGDLSSEQTKDIYYLDLKKNHILTTNIKFTEDNVKRLQTYLRNTERYDGTATDPDTQDADIDNWRSHFDIGMSHHSYPSNVDVLLEQSRFLYYCAQGNFPVTGEDVQHSTPYGYSNPYHPYADKIDVHCSSRSDIPDVGYTQLISHDLIGNTRQEDLYRIEEITEDVPHRFKNNKNGDASMAVCSRYNPNWYKLIDATGMDGTATLFLGSDLNVKYDVGVYPVVIPSSNLIPYYWDLANTYWSVPDADHADWNYVFKIARPTDNPTMEEYGGYIFEQWSDADSKFQHLGSFFIYSNANHATPALRDPITTLTYNNGTPIDLEANPNFFILDYGNTKRTLMILDKDDPTQVQLIPTDQYTAHDHTPLGELNVALTKMQIITTFGTNSLSPSLYQKSGGTETINNQPAVKAGQETVCAFMLYRASTEDGNPSTDFALPSLSHTQSIVSPSFMDNPAVWLTTAGRFDEETFINKDDGSDNMTQDKCIQHIEVGANNPTFSFDNGLSRCTFSNLHVAKRLGANDMPTDGNGDLVQTTMGNLVVKIADNNIKHGYLYNTIRKFDQNSGFIQSDYEDTNYGLNYSIGGVSIDSMYGESSSQSSSSLDDMVLLTEDNWGNSLLYKLGFQYRDLFPKFGSSTNIYDYSKVGSNDPKLRYETLDRLTTNPLIDMSSAIDLPQQDFTQKDSLGAGLPTYSLSIGTLIPTNLDGSASEEIVASGLPVKMNSPFFYIYSNLADGSFTQNTDTFNIVSVVQKKWIAGDFVFGDANQSFVVKLPTKITKIDIEIRDNNGDIVSLDDNSTVLFRLIRNPQQNVK